jgi:predicted metal-dependent phosphoesterase TrpH
MKPGKILRLAKERGLDAIVINDHDTIKGGLACSGINTFPGLRVIVGAEIKTSVGDVTGIFLKEEIRSRNYADVVAEIKKQGGITILNHPFVGHKLDDMNFNGIDLVEGYNGRTPPELNEKAIQLAKKLGKPVISGSDAHVYSEVGRCYTEYEDPEDLFRPLKCHYEYSGYMPVGRSQLIKSFKKKDAELFARTLLKIIKKSILS